VNKHSIISSFILFVVLASATAPATQDTLIVSHITWQINICSLGNYVSITHPWVRSQNTTLIAGYSIIFCTFSWIKSENLFSVHDNRSSLSLKKQMWHNSDDIACTAFGFSRIHSSWLGIIQYPMETEGDVYCGHRNTEDLP
jgi:hypothetical protein